MVPRDREETNIRRRDRLAGLVPERVRRELGAASSLGQWPAFSVRHGSGSKHPLMRLRSPWSSGLRAMRPPISARPTSPHQATRGPVDDIELRRFQTLLKACWRAFDAAVRVASGKELRKGPRGGGRDLEGVIRHVLGGDMGYLARLAWKVKKSENEDLDEELDRTRQAVLDALAAAAHGEVPARRPRGGVIWTPRYFVRRVAWHVLDHAWEIEDRVA